MEITHCARLGGVYNYDSTALRPFDDLRHHRVWAADAATF